MKPSNLVILLISLSITAGASLLPQQAAVKTPVQGPLAETVYKNIKVMKGMPAGDVVPAMKFMCASLKVDCGFCHEEKDFSADTKQTKQAARHMVEMQNDINTKNFRGRTQVTCMTCHQGSPNPQPTPVVLNVSRRSPKREGVAVVVADVLKRYQAAVGGDLKSVTLEGTAKNGVNGGPIKLTQGAPNMFLAEYTGHKLGFDGATTWVDKFKLSGIDALGIQHWGRFFRGEHAFDSFGELRYAGRDKLNGKDVIVLRTAGQGAVSEDLYFDEKSGLLVRIGSYTTTVLGRLPEITDFSDYRKVAGALIPFKVTITASNEVGEMTFTKATPNPTIPDGFFTMPATGEPGGTKKSDG